MEKQEQTQELNIGQIIEERFGKDKVAELKKVFAPRKLNILTIEDKAAVLRPITSRELSTYSMMVADPKAGLDKATSYLLSELWLVGDEEIRNDEEFLMAAMLQLQNVVELKKSNFYRY